MIHKRNSRGREIISELVEYKDLSDEEKKYPITQASCICYNHSGKILIVSDKPGKWGIPGGKPEGRESLEESAKREVLEEACVEIKNVKMICVNKIHIKNNPNKAEGENFIQSRFIGEISKILKLREDPATGNIFKRKFIDPSEFTKFIKWPEAQELIDKALEKIIITFHAEKQAIFREVDLENVKEDINNPKRLVYSEKQEAKSKNEEKYDCYFKYSKHLYHRYILTINEKIIIVTIIKINRDLQRIIG